MFLHLQEISVSTLPRLRKCRGAYETLPISSTTSALFLRSSSLYPGFSNTAMIFEAHSCCAWYRARSDAESLSLFEVR